jgi:hypothetical protein
MTTDLTPTPPLNDVQMMLLRLFSRPMSNEQLEDIRELLLTYYDTLLQKEVARVIEQKGIKRADFDRLY